MINVVNLFAEDTPQEKDFKTRLEAFQKAGDMAQASTIYVSGGYADNGVTLLTSMDEQKLEDTILRDIKSVKFEEVFPALQPILTNGISIEGGKYVPKLEPYKMVTVDFQKPVKNGSVGFSLVTGIKDGKIFISGYKKQ